MTTVDEVIRAIQDRPDIREQVRRAILTDELLELPDRFATLTVRVEDLAVQTAANTKAIAALEVQTAANTRAIAALEVQTAANTKAIAALEVQTAANTKAIESLTEMVKDLTASVKRLDDRVGSLMGERLERRLVRIGPPRISQTLELRSARIMYSPEVHTYLSTEFWDSVEMAEDSGKITREASARFTNTDLIMRSRRRTGDRQTLWVAVEASTTIRQKDITRAAQSAAALRAAFGEDAAGVVMGHRIRDEDKARAEANDLTVILVEESEVAD